jgi:hypothetical protein
MYILATQLGARASAGVARREVVKDKTRSQGWNKPRLLKGSGVKGQAGCVVIERHSAPRK